MKIVEMPLQNDRTSLGSETIKYFSNVHQQVALTWVASPESLPQVETFLAHFDCPLAFDFQKSLVDFLLPLSALPVLKDTVSQQWPQDQALQSSVNELAKQHQLLWHAGRFTFDLTTAGLVYAILNVTPDSFYDGGRYNSLDAMHQQVDQLVAAGADVIEVGGQTTKPGGFTEITPAEEIDRIQPAIDYLHEKYPSIPIAVDTYKLPVMEFAINHGVDIINDVDGFDTREKRALLASSNVGLVTMHSNRDQEYDNLGQAMVQFFQKNVSDLVAAGVDRQRICLDQGIGYAKVADGHQDMTMMRNINLLTQFNLPLLVAISRKGFGKQLFGLNKEDRLPVTLVAEAAMYQQGGRVFRVHDVVETKQLVKMLATIDQAYWFKPAGKQSGN